VPGHSSQHFQFVVSVGLLPELAKMPLTVNNQMLTVNKHVRVFMRFKRALAYLFNAAAVPLIRKRQFLSN